MKNKILTLIMSILCLSMILVSCGDKECETHVDENNDGVCDVCEAAVETETESITETATEAPCDVHADADADKICDACGRAIVTIVEHVTAAPSVETETRVPMVVNPIPEATGSFMEEITENDFITSATDTDLSGCAGHVGNIWYVVTESGSALNPIKTHSVYDYADPDNIIWTATDSGDVKYQVELTNTHYFIVTKTVAGATENIVSKQVYTYGNDPVGVEWVQENEFDIFVTPVLAEQPSSDGYAYYIYHGSVYVISEETNELLYKFDGSFENFIKRDTMNFVVGNNGYAIKHNIDGTNRAKVIVYDLTKWRSKKIEYTTPEYEDTVVSVLQNGNIIVCGREELDEEAASYDIYLNKQKYDLVYTIIDVENNNASKDVEFGYLIHAIVPASMFADLYGLDSSVDKYNIAIVSPIEDDEIANESKYLLVDNELNIIGELEEIAIESNRVGEDLFVRDVNPYSGIALKELVDRNGEHIRYLAYDYHWYYCFGFRVYDTDKDGDYKNDKHYAYDTDELIVDFSDYTTVDEHGKFKGDDSGCRIYEFYSLEKEVETEPGVWETEIYIYIPGKAPVKITPDETKTNWGITFDEFGYVVTYDTTVITVAGSETKTVAEFFNPNGIRLLVADDYNSHNFYSIGDFSFIRVSNTDGTTTDYLCN